MKIDTTIERNDLPKHFRDYLDEFGTGANIIDTPGKFSHFERTDTSYAQIREAMDTVQTVFDLESFNYLNIYDGSALVALPNGLTMEVQYIFGDDEDVWVNTDTTRIYFSFRIVGTTDVMRNISAMFNMKPGEETE